MPFLSDPNAEEREEDKMACISANKEIDLLDREHVCKQPWKSYKMFK